MTSSTSSSSKGLWAAALLAALWGCAGLEHQAGQTIPRPLSVERPVADRPSPQAAASVPVAWRVAASGGSGELHYKLFLQGRDGGEQSVQSGTSATWQWQPSEAGEYRVRAVVTDAVGQSASSPWSEPFEVKPPLRIEPVSADRPAPQAAASARIQWKTAASGGVGADRYWFLVQDVTGKESVVQEGASESWSWKPREAGTYRVRAAVADERGNAVSSPWSEPYEVVPALRFESLTPSRAAPQAAVTTTIRWTAEVTGGVGRKTYELWLREKDGSPVRVHAGPEPAWDWVPAKEGRYQVHAVVSDERGNRLESPPSAPYVVVPPVVAQELTPERPSPQMATTPIGWIARGTGGVGALTYTFHVTDPSGKELEAKAGPEGSWRWTARSPGSFRVAVRVSDAFGNAAEKSWPAEYAILPELTVGGLEPDRPSPQRGSTEVRWEAKASGGVGALSYEFQSRRGSGEWRSDQQGADRYWTWGPVAADHYEIRVRVTDSLGNWAVRAWDAPYTISAPRIAVLPLENLSGTSAPLRQFGESLTQQIRSWGATVLEEEKLRSVMASVRMRFTGGFDESVARAFRSQADTDALLVTSLETYYGMDPPRVGVLCRLVSTDNVPRILWAERVALTGDDSPGLLGLGLIKDPAVLWTRAQKKVLEPLKRFLASGEKEGAPPSELKIRPIRPKLAFNASTLDRKSTYTVVVLPFFNTTRRRNMEEILLLHVVNEFARRPQFSVIEPGVVRQRLLASRFVMDIGISLSEVNVIGNSFGADLVVTGTVRDYEDRGSSAGESKADLSLQVLDVSSKKVVWASRSYSGGKSGVYFFDWGVEDTASKLVSGMVSAVADRLTSERPRPAPQQEANTPGVLKR